MNVSHTPTMEPDFANPRSSGSNPNPARRRIGPVRRFVYASAVTSVLSAALADTHWDEFTHLPDTFAFPATEQSGAGGSP